MGEILRFIILISSLLLGKYILKEDWVKIYKSNDDPYIKKLMLDWGLNLFPENFEN